MIDISQQEQLLTRTDGLGVQQPDLIITQAKLIGAASDALKAIDEFNEWHDTAIPDESQGDLIYPAHIYRTLYSIKRLIQEARSEMNALSWDGSDCVLSRKMAINRIMTTDGDRRNQLVTFLLPEASPNGTMLRIRIKASDKRIEMSTALGELENWIGEVVPVRARVWAHTRDVLELYCEDEDVSKDVEPHLETALLVQAQHLCSAYPCEDRFVVDLTQDECRWVKLDARPFMNKQDRLNGRWEHIDHYDMSGDFQWRSSERAEASIGEGENVLRRDS